jgi:hypothetical protein
MLPKPWQSTNILVKSIPQGSTLMKKLFDKMGKGGGGALFRFACE